MARRIDDLRDALRAENERASKKIARIAVGTFDGGMGRYDPLSHLRGGYGVDITGTKYDPRVGDDRIGRMTTRQAEVAIDRLREFTDSGNIGYYQGSDGAIISRQAMLEVTYQTRRYNREIKEYRDSVGDVPVPWAGDNINAAEYYRDFVPKGMYLEDQAHYSLNERRLPTPTRYTSDSAARKIGADLKNSMLPSASRQRIVNARKQVSQMIDVIGDESLRDEVDALNDAQFWFMWTLDSSFADQFSLKYLEMKNRDDPKKSENYKYVMAQAADNATNRLEEMLNAGRSLPLA